MVAKNWGHKLYINGNYIYFSSTDKWEKNMQILGKSSQKKLNNFIFIIIFINNFISIVRGILINRFTYLFSCYKNCYNISIFDVNT